MTTRQRCGKLRHFCVGVARQQKPANALQCEVICIVAAGLLKPKVPMASKKGKEIRVLGPRLLPLPWSGSPKSASSKSAYQSHRAFQPILPCGNKLLQQKWDKTYYDEHKRLVKTAKPMVDSGPPPARPHVTAKWKKQQVRAT